jgi:hypothetical protein
MSGPSTLADLLDIEAIKQLKARYVRCLDTRDWDGLRAAFTPDATFSSPVTKGARIDLDTFIERIRVNPIVLGSMHQVYLPEIELREDGTAEGVWAMSSIHPPEDFSEHWPGVVAGRGEHSDEYADLLRRLFSRESFVFQSYGYYREEYRRTDAGWRIEALTQWHDRRDALPGFVLRMRTE